MLKKIKGSATVEKIAMVVLSVALVAAAVTFISGQFSNQSTPPNIDPLT